MIRNIVFDIGRVLVDFDPLAYLRSFGFSEETVQTLIQVVFGKSWNAYDRGDYHCVDDLCTSLVRHHPALRAEIQTVLRSDWVRIHTLKADTAAYLASLKERGYRVFLLSNLAKESHDFIKRYAFFHQVDGGVFSYQERVCKPERKIYEILLTRYALKPEETVFLDDSAANIAAAQDCGLHTVLFTTCGAAQETLEAILNE